MKKILYLAALCLVAACVPACTSQVEDEAQVSQSASDSVAPVVQDSIAAPVDTMGAIWSEQDSLADILINAK